MSKNPLKTIGTTKDGALVMGGLFQMHDTYGFCLADSLMMCQKLGFIPGIYNFIICAMNAGWKKSKIKRTVKDSIIDAYSPEWAIECLKLVDQVL